MQLYKIVVSNRKLPTQEFLFYSWMPSHISFEKIEKRFTRQLEDRDGVFSIKSIDAVNASGAVGTRFPDSISTTTSENERAVEGKLLPLWNLRDDNLLKTLARDILRIDGVKAVELFDYRGRLVYQELKDRVTAGFEIESIGSGAVAARGLGLFHTALSSDEELGRTQFLVIGRDGFKAILVPMPQARLVLRVAVARSVEASSVYDQIAPLLKSYFSSAATSCS